MDFDQILDQAIEMLQRRKRLSYRALKRQFDLDDAYLDDLKFEIIKVQQLAFDQDGEMLVWIGSPATPEIDTRREADAQGRLYTLLPGVMWVLHRERRITYRELKHIFVLDEALLAEIRKELRLRRLAVDEEGEVLVWTGETTSSGQPGEVAPSPQNTAPTATISSASPPPQPDVTATDATTNGPPVSIEGGPVESPADEQTTAPQPMRSAPEAERRQLTVMFCDLADSTQLSQQLDPEDLREVIRAYQQASAEVIQRFDGYVAQHLGDGLLIYFGWPRAHEDDAQRALHAGLGIVEAITTTLNPRLKAEKGVQLTVRLGIHTGPVVVGQMGSGDRLENLATGETVNIAARLEGLAQPNTVMISPATARLVEGAFVLEGTGMHILKGVAEPMPVFRVLAPLDSDRDTDASTTDGGMFLVGRDEESGLLLRRWEQSKEGLGQAVLISGEAGIGKSSLVAMLRRRITKAGYTRLTFRCSPYHTNSALYPVIEHVQHLLHFQPGDTPDTRLDKLERVLKGYSRPLEEVAPLYAALLSVPMPEGRYPDLNLTPPQQRQQTLDALVGWLLEEAERHPTLAMWEDLHWADPSTLELLGLVLEQIPTAPMLQLLTYRPQFSPPWPMRSHMTPIALNRLERPQVEALIRRQVGSKALPAEVVEHIVAKTDGVPLYVEELTKMLLHSDLLSNEADGYVLTGPLSAAAIPDTLQDFLMARLDQMQTAKEIAQLGAVVGRQFSYAVIQSISPQAKEALQAGLSKLVEAELLYQRGRPPRATYLFKHALIQDAAYASLLRSSRQEAHQQVARVLEGRFTELVAAQPELIAHHYTESGCYDKALPYWRQAGERLLGRSEHREAAGCFEQALAAIHHLPTAPDTQAQAIDLHLALRTALLPSGDVERILDTLRVAETLATALNDVQRRGRVALSMAVHYYFTTDYARGMTAAQVARRLGTESGDNGLQAVANSYMALGYYLQGAYPQGVDCLRQTLDTLEGHPVDEHFGQVMLPAVLSRALLGACLAEIGSFTEATDMVAVGLRIAQAAQRPASLMFASWGRGVSSLLQGEHQHALPLLEEAVGICQDASLPVYLGFVTSSLARAYILCGRADEARGLLVDLIEQGSQAAKSFLYTLCIVRLAEAALQIGDLAEARDLAQRALTLSSELREQGHQAYALHLLGDIARHGEPPNAKQAHTHYQQALALANELGMRPLQAHCHRGLGTLYQQTGQPEQARAELTTAINMYRDMEMTFWLPETEAALAAVEGKA